MGDPAANNYPAPPASPPEFGLTTAIKPITDGRWQGGIKYTPEGCITGTTRSLYQLAEKVPTTRRDEVTWIPYILSTYETCSTFSDDIDEARARARRALEADSERQLALEFWEGTISQSQQWQGADTPNTWLTDSTDPAYVTLASAAVDPATALRCLDTYLGQNNSGQQGAIHAPIPVFDYWAEESSIVFRDGKWYTPTGHLVITSPGYPGTSPDDSAYAAGSLWAYATDLPRVFMAPVRPMGESVQVVNRRNNDVAPLAERLALAEWERCRHAGIGIDLDTCDLI